jgi:hypothetical protein
MRKKWFSLLSEAQWELIVPLLPESQRGNGPARRLSSDKAARTDTTLTAEESDDISAAGSLNTPTPAYGQFSGGSSYGVRILLPPISLVSGLPSDGVY